jgi:hypothetical protein
VRPSAPIAVLAAAGALLTGCGGGGDSGREAAVAADARLAERIQASAQTHLREGRAIATGYAIEDVNEQNAPPPQDEAATPESGAPAKPKARRRPAKAAQPKRRKAPARPSTTPAPRSSGGTLLSAADGASFDRLAASLGGTSGVAALPARRAGSPTAAGTLRSGAAWSTMKTGVAAATFAKGTPSAATSTLLTRAITASDNAAAEQLWSALGAPGQAGALVQAQLRAAGDATTSVQTQRVRAGFTAFGQTEWALADQVRFTAGLSCTGAGRQVLALMGRVVADQRWGLGSGGVPARFKGGWGPGTGSGYLVRQMGILTIKGHPVAVAIANLPRDGAFGTGTRNLTAITRWLVAHLNARAAPVTPAC